MECLVRSLPSPPRPHLGCSPDDVSIVSTDELHVRQVRIYRPSAPSTQSAKIQSHHWRLDWDQLQGGKWENPLMGWASSADYMQGTNVKFNTKEDAIHFCEKQGEPSFSRSRSPGQHLLATRRWPVAPCCHLLDSIDADLASPGCRLPILYSRTAQVQVQAKELRLVSGLFLAFLAVQLSSYTSSWSGRMRTR